MRRAHGGEFRSPGQGRACSHERGNPRRTRGREIPLREYGNFRFAVLGAARLCGPRPRGLPPQYARQAIHPSAGAGGGRTLDQVGERLGFAADRFSGGAERQRARA